MQIPQQQAIASEQVWLDALTRRNTHESSRHWAKVCVQALVFACAVTYTACADERGFLIDLSPKAYQYQGERPIQRTKAQESEARRLLKLGTKPPSTVYWLLTTCGSWNKAECRSSKKR